MGIDGFTVANLGLFKEKNAIEAGIEAERLVKINKNKENVGQLAKQSSVDVDDKQNTSYSNGTSSDSDTSEELNEDTGEDFDGVQEFLDIQDESRFEIRRNIKSGYIELFDKEKNRIIETITPEQLMKLISKIKEIKGVFINKAI